MLAAAPSQAYCPPRPQDSKAHMRRSDQMAQHPSTSASSGQEQGGYEGEDSAGDTYAQYLVNSRDDNDVPDDPHLALTSQTLNADGTPKRPMNAFMIFARKRRPQISSENQMMRTGDISKILSKEWNSMKMDEKKFYLDQAKKLKDNFNNKYPDYVYRRRPNNSRKKKKLDADSPSADTDDGFEETSPIEGEYLPDPTSSSYAYARSHNSSSSSTYDNQDAFVPQHVSSYSYATDYPSSHMVHQGSRSSMMSSGQESSLPPPILPLRIPAMGPNVDSQGYAVPPLHQPNLSPHQTSHSMWESSRSSHRPDPVRGSSTTLPALDTNVTGLRSGDMPMPSSSRSDAFSPQVPHRPWSSSASSNASSSSGGAASSHYPPTSPFPTLTSSFRPAYSPTSQGADVMSSPTSHHHPSPQDYYSHSSPSTQTHGRGMSSGGTEHHRQGMQNQHSGFVHSQTLPQPSPSGYMSNSPAAVQWAPATYSGRTDAGHHQEHQRQSIQSISTYSLQQSSGQGTSPPSGGPSGGSSAHGGMGYWDRRYDGR